VTWQIGGISPAPSAEEIAAITAALALVEAEMAAAAPATAPADHLSMWVEASRRSAQRASLQRGPWRLSGRMGGRSRV